MKDRYRLYRRGRGIFYLHDGQTGRQVSLRTKAVAEAKQIALARNQACAQPHLNVSLARAYLSAKTPEFLNRRWCDVMNEMLLGYAGNTRIRFQKVVNSAPFEILAPLPLLSTESTHFLSVLRHPKAGVSTNVWLRILHNRALNLGWLLAPVLAKAIWPKIKYKSKRGITAEEHRAIVAAEHDPTYRLFYEMLWHTGGSQTDVANLHRRHVDPIQNVIFYRRKKLEQHDVPGVMLVIGPALKSILDALPSEGHFFPVIRLRKEVDRASRFRKVCLRAKISGVTLHSYRYGWAERACQVGMPEREAMSHLGHNSRAVHRAYANKARNVTLPLEFYEQKWKEKVLQLDFSAAVPAQTAHSAG